MELFKALFGRSRETVKRNLLRNKPITALISILTFASFVLARKYLLSVMTVVVLLIDT